MDYLGLADQLKRALATYTESGGQGNPTYDTKQAIAVMQEKHGLACDMMHGFDQAKLVATYVDKKLSVAPAMCASLARLDSESDHHYSLSF